MRTIRLHSFGDKIVTGRRRRVSYQTRSSGLAHSALSESRECRNNQRAEKRGRREGSLVIPCLPSRLPCRSSSLSYGCEPQWKIGNGLTNKPGAPATGRRTNKPGAPVTGSPVAGAPGLSTNSSFDSGALDFLLGQTMLDAVIGTIE